MFIAGERTQVAVFELRLSHSGAAVHVAYGSEGQEAFFEGHVIAFARIGGVRIWTEYVPGNKAEVPALIERG